MAQIRIDDETYNKLKEAAEFNKRTVGQHILFLLDNELTFNEIRGLLVGQTVPAATLSQIKSSATLGGVKKAMRETKGDHKQEKNLTLEDLTEKDLATAKITFEDRSDFKEPKKWDSKAWPTV